MSSRSYSITELLNLVEFTARMLVREISDPIQVDYRLEMFRHYFALIDEHRKGR